MQTRPTHLLLAAALAAAPISCANESATRGASSTDSLTSQAQELEKKAAELRDQERRLRSQAQELEDQRRALESSSASMSSSSRSSSSDLLPPNPKPGECYARVILPAQYEKTAQRVLKREASEKIEVIPARYGPSEERVLIKEATSRLEVVPPVYETVEERIMVRPASTRIVEVPATYKTTTERVLVKPAHTAWKKGTGIGTGEGTASSEQVEAFVTRFGDQKVIETRVEDTGEIMCLVEVPAQYKTVRRRVVDRPASSKTIEVPAEYSSIRKQVVKSPGRTREVAIPAVYKTVKTTKLLEPPRQNRVSIPEQYETVERRTKTSDERVEWRPVLCEVNMTRSNISQLQSRLKSNGCYRCEVDGIMGRCTLDAMRCYCEPKSLPWGKNYLTTQCISSLGLKL